MKTLKKIIAASALLLIMPISTSFAAEGEAEVKKLNPWVDCGIGPMLFKETQWAAVSSNIIWDLGTTAVTSNVSSPETCEHANKVAAARFINETYANLEEETVKGNGRHVTAMLDIMGCEGSSHAGITNAVRADFGLTVGQSDYLQKTDQAKAEAYYNIVMAKVTGKFAQSCRVI